MELVKGVPITKYCDDHELSPRERLELFVPVCQAIQHAHQKGVIHRDIKPSNVLVATYDGKPVPKVIDFGVAKAMGKRLTDRTLFTAFGNIVGTLEYMSPEQAELNALDIDTRSDVYALGVLLYELLTGSTPISRKRLKQAALEEALRLIREEEPPKPSTRLSTANALPSIAAHRKTDPAKLTKMMRGELDWMVMQALEKDRNRRYESASALAADVQRYLRDEPVTACPPSAGYRLRKFVRRHKARLRTALAVAGVLLLAIVGASWMLWDRAARAAIQQADQSKRLAETKQTVDVALARAEQLRDRAGEAASTTSQEADAVLLMWGQAEAALGQAQVALKTGAADDHLQERVLAMTQQIQIGRSDAEHRRTQLQRQEKLLLDLEEARMVLSTEAHKLFDRAGTAAKCALAFTAYGLEVKPGGAEQLARRIRSEEPAVREALIVALDVWSFSTSNANAKELVTELQQLAGAVDDDAWRRDFRKASSARDSKLLLRLSAEARRSSMAPANLFMLAVRLYPAEGGREEAIALLRWARSRHPTDLWFAIALGMALRENEERTPADIEEEIGCYRVALALRPNASVVHVDLGNALTAKNQVDEAIAAYRKAININPNYVNAYNHLGNALQQKNQWDEAIAAYRKAIDSDPKFAPAYSNLGLALRAKNQLHEAITAHRKAIDIDPTSATAYNNLGAALQENKQLDEAIAAYHKAIDNNPKYAEAYYNLGLALRANDQLDEAIAAYRKAIDNNPRYAEAYGNLGIALVARNQLDEAIAVHRKAVEIDPKNGTAYYNLGIALRAKNQLDEAIAAYRKAVEIAPTHWPAYNNLGTTLRANKQLDEAIVAYRKAIALNPKFAAAYSNLGSALRANKQLDEAIAACRKAIAIDPRYASAYDNLGDCLRDNNQLDEAITAYRKAIEINPRFATAYYDLGIALRANKQLEEAIAAYRKCVEINPKFVTAYYDLGVALRENKQLEEAVAAFRKAIDLSPKSAQAYYGLGLALGANNQLDEAIAAFRKAIDLNPKNAPAFYNLGHALGVNKQWDEAVAAHRKAIDINPKFTQAYVGLGNALRTKNQLDEAIAAYSKAIELDPKSVSVFNSLAWLLATHPDPKVRAPAKAVELATKATELAPKVGTFWNTLGVARYRAGDWKAALTALDKSMELRKGGDGSDMFFVAMAHWQLGEKKEARRWYDRAVQWMDDNEQALANNTSSLSELRRFRTEAMELLDIPKLLP